MCKFIDLNGQKFGRLTIIQKVGSNKRGNALWLCKCECGNEKEIIIRSIDLRNNRTQSCGCLQIERSTKHGRYIETVESQTYNSWHNMIQRCINSNSRNYHYYGGRGIKVCKRWMKFENFLEDMGEVPEGYQIDRIDNDGNYCKENCQWVTPKQNSRNKRNNHLITYKEKTQCVSAWAEELDINSMTIVVRLRRGWSIEKALTAPVKKTQEYSHG